jgi:hypothetical protein
MKTLIGLFSCLSRALNVLRGGHPDMTLSAASYAEDLPIRKPIDWVFFNIFGEADHCRRWFIADVELARKTVHDAETHHSSLFSDPPRVDGWPTPVGEDR